MRFVVRGIPQDIADEVRRTRRSPGYGHPAHEEVAGGTGPCRCCLKTFVPGLDRRLLFTWRPRSGEGSLMAPGPVFIHAEPCEAYAGEGFPEALRVLGSAYREVTVQDRYSEEPVEQNLVFLGFAGMMDPPRDEAKQAVAVCR
jgi:hypothetical protein